MAIERIYNAAEPSHVRGRKEQEKKAELRKEAAYEYVMGAIQGRHFVWLLLGDTGLFRDSFTGNSHTFYNEGKRSVGLKLQHDLEEKSSENFIKMWQEHLVQQEKEEKQDVSNRTEKIGTERSEGEEY